MRKILLIIKRFGKWLPFLSDKSFINGKSNFNKKNDKVINDGSETANVMNTFFSNIVTDLNVPEYS